MYGEPPKFLVHLQRDAKYHFLIRCVGQYIWAEIACWRTSVSALKGWKLTSRKLVTPLFGIAYWLGR